jgi:hypothetical protein
MIQGGHATCRLEDFCANFRWADDKYPTGLPLREISEEIQTVSALFGLPLLCRGPDSGRKCPVRIIPRIAPYCIFLAVWVVVEGDQVR